MRVTLFLWVFWEAYRPYTFGQLERSEKMTTSGPAEGKDYLEVFGACEHNLKSLDLRIPKNKLVVFSGISGSGKSSLAFNTIYAEGQRRYLECFTAYARNLIGGLQRPEVDKINGLSPVVSIEQKSTSNSPRSTVGTVTEVYDFFRLLYARVGTAYSHVSGREMVKSTTEQICQKVLSDYEGVSIQLLAPQVRGRKGHYNDLFRRIIKRGYSKVRVDGDILEPRSNLKLDRYVNHDIELVIDKCTVQPRSLVRVKNSIQLALKEGNGVLMVMGPDGSPPAYLSTRLTDPESGIAYDDPSPSMFSFNSPRGACQACRGLGTIQKFIEGTFQMNPEVSLIKNMYTLTKFKVSHGVRKEAKAFMRLHGIGYDLPMRLWREKLARFIWDGDQPEDGERIGVPREFELLARGLTNYILNPVDRVDSIHPRGALVEYLPCQACQGSRLQIIPRHYRIDGKSIADLNAMSMGEIHSWIQKLEFEPNSQRGAIAETIMREIRQRVGFIIDVGLDYLGMGRGLKTLSGGEAQRIRLATQVGTGLTQVMYVLDEPSIGLHPRDNHLLINTLKQLRDLGNSIIVVEHDRDIMLHSDHIVDFGPGAGPDGGRIVGSGAPGELSGDESITASYLNGSREIRLPRIRRKGNGSVLTLRGARGNNLKNVDLDLPLGLMIGVTGVSGSGKSSLIRETLYEGLQGILSGIPRPSLPYDSFEGVEFVDKVIEVDQSPIGRTPRSNPATYTGVFSLVRDLYSQLPHSKIYGYKPGRFSFNVVGGRCEECKGAGKKVVELGFLPDVLVVCESCRAQRFNAETLGVRYRGKSISDVLNFTVKEAIEFFAKHPKIVRKLKVMNEVGLGYIGLGQHSTTLSGGEAQRVKLSKELSKRDTKRTLYILDEPTTGLHFQDVSHLIELLNRLVDRGNTVLIIEHNLEVIKVCDYLVDLGPEGGEGGGEIVVSAAPEVIVRNPRSHTGRFLKGELNGSSRRSVSAKV